MGFGIYFDSILILFSYGLYLNFVPDPLKTQSGLDLGSSPRLDNDGLYSSMQRRG